MENNRKTRNSRKKNSNDSKKEISSKQVKQMLPEAFMLPQPLQKDIFLQEIKESIKHQGYITRQRISYREFIFIQIAYIRKTTWCLSFILFLFALTGVRLMNQNMLWSLAALIPFLAICVVTENIRSEIHGMAELEITSRFSLRSVMFARTGILGTVHFVLMIIIIVLVNKGSTHNFLQTAVYLMVPYFMTTFSGLWISRKIHGKESIYACMGAAVMVSILLDAMCYMQELIYRADLFQWWLIGLVLLIVFTAREMKTMFMRAEGIA